MKKYRIVILLIVGIVILAVAYFFLFKGDSLEVSTMKSYKASITKTIEVSGTIDSSDIEVVYPDTGKTAVKTYVKENDVVQKNQLLAELDSDDLYISLEKVRLNLEDLNEKLNDLNSNKSDLAILNNTLSKSKENYSKLTQDLSLAKEDLKRAEALYAENVISKAEYDKYVSEVNNLTLNLKTAELNLNDASVNYSNMKEQKASDKLSMERQIKSANLDIESLNKKIEDTKIYSSIDGVVTEFQIKEGQKISNGERIVIHGTSSLELTAFVSQQEAVSIKEGLKSLVTVDGMDTSYEGVVSFVSKVAKTDSNGNTAPKVEIKIKITNPDEYITFGYEGDAKIIVDSGNDLLVVKNESVKSEGGKKYVYLLNRGVAAKTYVETGITDGYLINITSGIRENDLVIVNPPFDLIDGMKVKKAE